MRSQLWAPSRHPPIRLLGMGLTSVILGSVGALLFFLPVLGIPLGAVGLVFGIVGLLLAILGGWTSLRWSVAGIVVSGRGAGNRYCDRAGAGRFPAESEGPSRRAKRPRSALCAAPGASGDLIRSLPKRTLVACWNMFVQGFRIGHQNNYRSFESAV